MGGGTGSCRGGGGGGSCRGGGVGWAGGGVGCATGRGAGAGAGWLAGTTQPEIARAAIRQIMFFIVSSFSPTPLRQFALRVAPQAGSEKALTANKSICLCWVTQIEESRDCGRLLRSSLAIKASHR